VHPLVRPLYGAAGLTARAAAFVAPAGGGKLRESLRGRRGVRARLAAWAAAHRDPARPLLWVHAPSVGEGLQARPVLELARAERPDVQVAYTHFSSSAAPFARRLVADGLADVADYLPFDTGGDADALLATLAPHALVFSKLDVWPVLAERARRRGVRLGLVSATLPAGSSRRGRLAAALLRDAYAALDAVGAIDDRRRRAARRARRIGRPDPGHGRHALRPGVAPRPRRRRRRPAARRTRCRRGGRRADRRGPSIHPRRRLDLAGRRARARRGVAGPAARGPARPPRARPPRAHRGASRARRALGRDRGPALRALLGTSPARGDVVLVDRLGVLAELYAAGDAAFVGGGFHAAGLHSVLEPAAFGIPVAFGPRHDNSRDAGLLLEAGGASAASTGRALGEAFRRWRASARFARTLVPAPAPWSRRGLGADRRAWDLVRALLDSPR
jgi:3-deoxy-D-manno-octulosonic-acid transferase